MLIFFDWRRARATHQFKYAASAIVLQSDESTSFAANRDIPLRWSGRDAHQLAIDIPLLRSGRQEHPLSLTVGITSLQDVSLTIR